MLHISTNLGESSFELYPIPPGQPELQQHFLVHLDEGRLEHKRHTTAIQAGNGELANRKAVISSGVINL